MSETEPSDSGQTQDDLGEFDLIETYFRPLTLGRDEALALTDDAGILTPPDGKQLIVTTDALVAGQHFLTDMSPDDLAHKVLGVNLSDLAAMGAKAETYTLALAAPKPLSRDWLKGFTKGLAAAQTAHSVFLLGGDTVTTPGPLTLSVTAMGWVPFGQGLLRSGAALGDGVYVTGTIGDAALGLLVAKDGLDLTGDADLNQYLSDRYTRPQARTALGPKLIGIANACADVSDGLVADLGHIADASGVRIDFDAGTIPYSEAAAAALERAPDKLETVLTGGDDYELVFTAPEGAAEKIDAVAKNTDTSITRIGMVSSGAGVRITGPDGRAIQFSSGGYRHF